MMLRYRIRPPYVTMLNWPPRSYDRDGERLGIALEPDIWCRLRAQCAAARADFQATALDYAWARQSLAATASKAWYQAVELRRRNDH
jgi:outer membrane protein TolC